MQLQPSFLEDRQSPAAKGLDRATDELDVPEPHVKPNLLINPCKETYSNS